MTKEPTEPSEFGPAPAAHLSRDEIDLSAVAYAVGLDWRGMHPERVFLDFALSEDLPRIDSDLGTLEAILRNLLESAQSAGDSAWGCITILSGQTELNRSHHSLAHPVAIRPKMLAEARFTFLEVHDTATHLGRDALTRIARRTPSDAPREIALSQAAILADSIGVPFHLDSTPGCGTQALLLFRDEASRNA